MQSCTPPISNLDDSGYLSHSGGSLPTNTITKAVDTVISQKHHWRNCPCSSQPLYSFSLNDSGVPASPTIEIQQTLSLYDDFEDSSLSGISEVQDELSDSLGKSEANNCDSRNHFDSGTTDLSSSFEISSLIHKPVIGLLNTKRKCNITFYRNGSTRSPKRKSYPKTLATYFLSNGEPDSSTIKYCSENNTPRVTLAGRSYVDFLYELGENMNFSLIVSKIFSYLPPEDLLSLSMVSSTWYKVCCKDRIANKRRHQYIRSKKINIENTFFVSILTIVINILCAEV